MSTPTKRHGHSLSRKLRFWVLQRDGHRCVYCGATVVDGVRLEVDHVIPRALGGTDDRDNLVTACRPCNAGKSDHVVDQVCEHWQDDVGPPSRLNGWSGSTCGQPAVARVAQEDRESDDDAGWRCARHAHRAAEYRRLGREFERDGPLVWWVIQCTSGLPTKRESEA